MFEVKRYSPEMACEWNQFVAQSKNATFLFDRRYMDYHSDRFADHSLMVYHRHRLYALLPGNVKDDTFHSHQGLTYGGLIIDYRATADGVCETFLSINEYLRQAGIRHVVYKPVPHIYHQMPAEEDLYALFVRCGARLTQRDVSSTIELDHRLRFAESRRSGLRKAHHEGLVVQESHDLEAFWQVLTDNLRLCYGAHPVHQLSEMQLLKARFPENIRLFMVTDHHQQPIGGTLLYLTPQVVHTQYISASPEGKKLGALDLLFDSLLAMEWHRRYFDFGTSAQEISCEVNSSLLFQKLGFGGRAVCYDRYHYDL
jgi:hypothetical protein